MIQFYSLAINGFDLILREIFHGVDLDLFAISDNFLDFLGSAPSHLLEGVFLSLRVILVCFDVGSCLRLQSYHFK